MNLRRFPHKRSEAFHKPISASRIASHRSDDVAVATWTAKCPHCMLVAPPSYSRELVKNPRPSQSASPYDSALPAQSRVRVVHSC